MNTLIIHPNDKSTDFLCPIYSGIKNKEVIRGGISKTELRILVSKYNRILMMGHGTPLGLLAVGQFPDEHYTSYIIDESFVSVLQGKDNVFIWCFADQFVEKFQLNGFYSGMFISEVQEAQLYNYHVSQEVVTFSNHHFSHITGKYISYGSDIIHERVIDEYGKYIHTNPIVHYNHARLKYQKAK